MEKQVDIYDKDEPRKNGKGLHLIIDLHVHTNQASHSNLDPHELVQEAKRLMLDGVCVTEHDRAWDIYEARRLAEELQFLFLRGIEVSTDMGHILVYGLHEYLPGIHKLEKMKSIVNELGGAIIIAHPYRGFCRKSGDESLSSSSIMEEALEQPFLEYVDGLEVMNGATEEPDNRLALEVAGKLGLAAVGGSDAHSKLGIGCFATMFNEEIRNEEDLIRQIKARTCRPAKMRLPEGASQTLKDEHPSNLRYTPLL